MGVEAMTITLSQLFDLISAARNVPPDFWKQDPLYVQLGEYTDRHVANAEPFAVANGPSIVVDVNAKDEALGIEFAPM